MPFDDTSERDDDPFDGQTPNFFTQTMVLPDGRLISGYAIRFGNVWHWRWREHPDMAVPAFVARQFRAARWIRAPAHPGATVCAPAWFRTTMR